MPTDVNTGIEWVPIGFDLTAGDLLLVPLNTAVHRINLAENAPAVSDEEAGVIDGSVAGSE